MNKLGVLKLLAALALFTLGAVVSGAPKDPEKEAVKKEPRAAKTTVEATPPTASGKSDQAESEADLQLPVASIDGRPLTLGYIESILDKQSPLLRKSLEDEEKKKDFIKRVVNMELLAQEAVNRGFDKHNEVSSVEKNQLASVMHRKIAEEINDKEPTEEDLREYYEENITRYRKPEKVRARHILITDEAKAKKLLKEIKSKETSQHEFRRLAQENSEDETTRLRGGDLSFFTRPEDRKEGDEQVDPAIVEAAFKIEKNGDIYPSLVKTDKGFHIIMRTGHRKKMDLSFEDAKDRLVSLVRREQRKSNVENAINALKKRFNTDIYEENLKYVVIDLSGGPPEPDAKGGLTRRERKRKAKKLKLGAQPLKPGKKPHRGSPN